jgi:type IV pilus assembly protein PilO
VNKKPALIAALVGAVLSVVLVVALITPKAGQVRAKQKEIVTAQQEQASKQAELEQLQAAAKDAPKDRKTLAVLKAQVPPTADLPGLIRLLNTTADRSGVDFQTITPGQPTAQGSYSVIPVQLTVVGGFFAVDQYLYLLETLPRVSKVTALTLAPGPSGAPQLSVILTANFFTTDTSAGPGSVPGGNQPVAPAPSPVPTTTPGG